MRILTIGPDKDLLTAGTPSFVRHKEYAKQVEEIHAIIFARRKYGKEKVEIAPNAWAHPTYSRGTIGLFIDAYRIGRELLRHGDDWVISTQDPFESGLVGYALAKITHTPFLIQEHGDFFSTSHWRHESLLNQVRYRVGLWLIRSADHIRPVSKRIALTLEKIGVPRNRMSVSAVYTDTASFRDAQPDTATSALRPEHGVLILTMARFVPQKNLTLLIRVFREVLARGARARLLIVGRGEEGKQLHTLATEAPEGSIVFRDWVERPEPVLKAADIYALSSNYEGWGRVCIEALAAGLPIVMTDVGCAGDVVVDGKNGTVVPVGDERAFTDALYKLATDSVLRERYAKEGKETVAHMVTREESIELYIQALEACKNK